MKKELKSPISKSPLQTIKMQPLSSPSRGISADRPSSSALSGSVSSLCGGDDSPHTLESERRSSLSSKELFSEDNNELSTENLEKTLTEENVAKINDILAIIECLSDREKLVILSKFPLKDKDDFEESDVDNGGLSDFGVGVNQTEHSDALSWVMSHLEEDCTTCLKKQEVYDDYKSYCLSHNVKYLSTADFGKVMKRAFPNIKARRLGARGQSKYCYSGLKNRNAIKSPMIVDVGLNCHKKAYNQSDDKNSDKDSSSSNYQHPDLSNIPEYGLSHNILIDSALVIMDFIKRVGLTKDVTSLKQAVEHLLLNHQVEMRTPHALRLLPHFQQIDSQRSKKKYLVDQVFKTIKKEETLASPNSPISIKRPKMSYMSPSNEKVLPYYDNKIHHAPPFPSNQSYSNIQSSRFNYPVINNNNLAFYNNNMLNMSQNAVHSHGSQMLEMSPVNNIMSQKQFVPITFSTPIKDSPLKIVSPTLNSPLLERNPGTTKKLEILNTSKSIHQNNSINYPNITSRTPLVDRSMKMPMYHSNIGYNYEASLNINDHNSSEISPLQNCTQSNTSYLDRDISSPMTMTSRNYDCPTYEDECDIENFDKCPPLKRHIGSEIDVDLYPSPSINHYDSDYGNHIPMSSRYCQQNSEGKAFLDTPVNSPTNESVDNDESEGSSRTHTPLTYSALLNPKDILSESDNKTVLNQSPSLYHTMMNSKDIFSLDHTPTAQTSRHNNCLPYNSRSSFSNEHIHSANDEFSVSSTTNTCALDADIHPSTTVLHSNVYK